MKTTLRDATPQDDRFVQAVYFETQRWIIEALFGWRGDDVETAVFLQSYDVAHTSIIVTDGADAGWLTVQRGADIHIDSIYLTTAKQRQGIGRSLLQRLIAEADSARKLLRLSTAKINPARRLYERLGFVAVAEDEYKVYMERSLAARLPGAALSEIGSVVTNEVNDGQCT